jgi:gluconolactonase
MSRRTALAGGAGALATAAIGGRALALEAGTAVSSKYPDTAYQSLDPAFDKYNMNAFAGVDVLYQGTRWGEGPVYIGDDKCYLWSDIPNNRLLRYDEESGQVTTFRSPSNYSNGNTRDRQGRLITCEHAGRLIRTEHDGTTTVLAETFQGKKLNSPNDVVVHKDDAIWFTDPPYGLSDYVGRARKPEVGNNVYRLDKSGALTIVAGDVEGPNGLAFSPDWKKLYVVNTSVSPCLILVYDVTDNGTKLANKKVFVTCDKGYVTDGIRLDVDGNIWAGWYTVGPTDDNNAQLGVRVFSPQGKAIGRIATPEGITNLTWGGWGRNRLFMVGGHGAYAAYVNAKGVGYFDD